MSKSQYPLQMAFKPLGKTVYLAVSNTPTVIQVPVTNTIHIDEGNAIRIANPAAHGVFVSFGRTAAEALARCTIPTAGAPMDCLPCCKESSEIFGIDSNVFIAAVAANNSFIYLTPGQGI